MAASVIKNRAHYKIASKQSNESYYGKYTNKLCNKHTKKVGHGAGTLRKRGTHASSGEVPLPLAHTYQIQDTTHFVIKKQKNKKQKTKKRTQLLLFK